MCVHCSNVAHNEVVQVLVPNATSPEAEMVPMSVSTDAWADIRMRTQDHNEALVGDPGAFWMLHAPPAGALLHATQCTWNRSNHWAR
jgi:hypothetical protein